jgi:hypothetical protein
MQRRLAPPVDGRAERFQGDVRESMVTDAVARTYGDRSAVPTVPVGEPWRRIDDGDHLSAVQSLPEDNRSLAIPKTYRV